MTTTNRFHLLERARSIVAGVGGSARHAGHRFLHDRRGATAVQAIVMMPVMLAAMYLGMLLFETIQVRRSLHTGTYLATRYLSLYPPDNLHQDVWAGVARQFVFAELKASPWVNRRRLFDDGAGGGGNGRVEIEFTDGCYDCGCKFKVKSSYKMDIAPDDVGDWAIPDLYNIELLEERFGEVICR